MEAQILKLLNEKKEATAFRLLLKMYQEPLYWFIRKMVHIHEDADDVVQNTFLKVYKNISSFKKKSLLKTWIYKIAYHEALHFINKRQKQLRITSEAYTSHILNNLHTDPYFNGSELEWQLQKAILQLPEKQRQVFQMRYFEDLKFKEISEITGTTVGALKASYHLSEKKLRTYLIPLVIC